VVSKHAAIFLRFLHDWDITTFSGHRPRCGNAIWQYYLAAVLLGWCAPLTVERVQNGAGVAGSDLEQGAG
jgi:hypothetical protein